MKRSFHFASTLYGGALALALFASCDNEKNLYDPEQAIKNKQAEYAAAFEKMFGKIDSNNDWGFGKNVSRTATRVGTYVYGDDDESVYKTSMPENLPAVTTYNTTWNGSASIPNSSAYYMAEGTTSVNCHAGGCDIYIPAGEYTLEDWHTRDNTNVYLLEGAHVTFTGDLNENYSNNIWSIAEGASITVNGDLIYNFKLYNRGTISANNLSLYANATIYNGGTINVAGEVAVKNSPSEFVNAGELNCGSVGIEGSGHFQNLGTAVVSGNTIVNSNNCGWDNEGSYTTENYTYNAGSDDVINGCKLIVNDLFKIILGEGYGHYFYINGNSSVMTKNFQMGIGCIQMGANSMLKVTDEAVMGITKLEYYGIYGPESGSAVFTAPVIKGGKVGQWYTDNNANYGYMANYGGNLYVATDNHFEDGMSGQYPYIYMTGNAQIKSIAEAEAEVYIPASNCTDGFGSPNSEPTLYEARIFAEDLGSIGDFDFNDVVVDVKQKANGTTDVTIQAAGGTLPLYVSAGGQTVEVHKALLGNALKEGDALPMINTGTGKRASPYTINVNSLIEASDITLSVEQTIGKGETAFVELLATSGKAPQKICVPSTKVNWSIEFKNIKDTYSKFESYIGDRNVIWWE